jgi:hypothetical protein
MFLGIYYYEDRHYVYNYYKSPVSNYTEGNKSILSIIGNKRANVILLLIFLVSCCGNYDDMDWKFNHSKIENYRGYLKSYDTINLSIKKSNSDDNQYEFLRNHDVTYTIGNDTFQEIICHTENLGENDEVSYFNYTAYWNNINIKLIFLILLVVY